MASRRSSPTSATSPPWVPQLPGSTSCTTASPRCRSAAIRSALRSVNVDGTATLLQSCRAAGVGKVDPPLVERRVRRTRVQSGAPRHGPPAPGTVRCRQARRRVGMPARRGWRARRHDRAAAHDRRTTAASASSPCCSTGSPTAPIRSFSATAPTVTSSSTPTTSPRCASAPRAVQERRSTTPGPTASARCARRSSTSAPTPGPAPAFVRCRCVRRRRRCGSPARLGLTPFAPYHWLMYGQSMWFDIDHARAELNWQPRYSNDEMLAESYDWYVANRTAARRRDPSHLRTVVRRRHDCCHC